MLSYFIYIAYITIKSNHIPYIQTHIVEHVPLELTIVLVLSFIYSQIMRRTKHQIKNRRFHRIGIGGIDILVKMNENHTPNLGNHRQVRFTN